MSDMGELADRFLQACANRKILVATAESCTGGMIISLLTDIPGSSSMVDRGFVTYSNEAKTEMIGVSPATLDKFGAVSSETAQEMAAGALARSRAGITLAVTGIAGPGGGTAEKPMYRDVGDVRAGGGCVRHGDLHVRFGVSGSVPSARAPALARGPVSIDAQKQVPPGSPQFTATTNTPRRRDA